MKHISVKALFAALVASLAVANCGKKEEAAPVAAAGPDGAEIFAANCATCHGEQGKGDGPAGAALKPAPRNFTIATGWKNGATLEGITKTLNNGIEGGSMVAYNETLSAEEIAAVAQHVLKLAGK